MIILPTINLYRLRRIALCAATLLTLASCASHDRTPPPTTVPSVDLARYTGTWYEIARLPMWFQRHCVDSKAVYTPRTADTVGVHNECVTKDGSIDQIDGMATVVDPSTNARLTVVFDNFFARLFGSSKDGNYWILDLDPEYRTSLVGTPDRRYLWILSRTPTLEPARYERLVAQASAFGYPVADLVRAPRSIPAP